MPKTSKKETESVAFVEGLKRRWMATVDAIVDPLMIVDEDYNIKKANKALSKMAETDIRKIVGKKCYKIFAGRKSPCPGCQMHKSLKSETHHQYELENVREGRFHEVTSQPIFDPEMGGQGSLQVYRDRTEAQQLQQQLLQSEKLASIGLLPILVT